MPITDIHAPIDGPLDFTAQAAKARADADRYRRRAGKLEAEAERLPPSHHRDAGTLRREARSLLSQAADADRLAADLESQARL